MYQPIVSMDTYAPNILKGRIYLFKFISPILLYSLFHGSFLATASTTRVKRQYISTSSIGDIRTFLNPDNEVDLVLMIDSSKGMGKSSFYTEEKPILRSIIRQYAVIMPEKVRLAAITFAVRTDIVFDYITGNGGETLNKCELFWGEEESIWGRIQYFDDADDNQRTEMLDGLNQAADIFTSGKVDRPNVIQVLLIVTDADIQTTDYTSTINKAEELRSSGIHIFVIGTGTWLKPGNAESLASTDYFDFISEWENMLFEAPPHTTYGPGDPFLFEQLPLNESFCESCRANSACYCNPYTGKAVCKCNKGCFYEKSGEQEVCSPCALHEFKDTVGGQPCTNCPPPSYTEVTGATHIDQCLCPDGFSCTAECVPNPCGVNSHCEHSSVSNIECTCLDGWEDAYNNQNAVPMNVSCTTHIDYNCENHSCQNGATCVTMDSDYFCVCPIGYIGDHCETEKDMCKINFCQNGATCTSRLNSFSCECPDGFRGTYCTDVDTTSTTVTTLQSTAAVIVTMLSTKSLQTTESLSITKSLQTTESLSVTKSLQTTEPMVINTETSTINASLPDQVTNYGTHFKSPSICVFAVICLLAIVF